jgi:hypothetical protein
MHLIIKESGPYFAEIEPLAVEFNRYLSALSIRGLSVTTLIPGLQNKHRQVNPQAESWSSPPESLAAGFQIRKNNFHQMTPAQHIGQQD